MDQQNGFVNGNSSHNEVAPSFLFGDRTNKRKAMALSGGHHRPSGFGSPGILKKDLFSSPGGKNVHWSSDLVQEQIFSSKPKEPSQSLFPGRPNAPGSSLFSGRSSMSPSGDAGSSSARIAYGAPLFSSQFPKGPPLSSLDANELEPPQKLSRPDVNLERKESALAAINSNLNAFNAPTDSSDFWVTVFGFTPEDRDLVLNVFSRHGTVVSHNLPRLGNWVHLRYSSVMHAQQALNRNGNIIADRIMVGVVKCTDKEVISDSKMNPLNISTSPTTNAAEISIGQPVMQSTFRNAQEDEHLNGSRASVSYGDAASFNRSRLSALSRNGMRPLRASEADVSMDTSRKNDSFLSKIYNFIAPQ